MKRFPYVVALAFALASCVVATDEGKSKEVVEPTPQVVGEPAPPPPVAQPTPTPAPIPTPPTPTPVPTPVATNVAIASVQMAQNCPPRKQAIKAKRRPAPSAKRLAPGPPPSSGSSRLRANSNGNFQQPCTQSSIQISLSGAGAPGSQVTIKALRLLTTDGKQVATVTARKPTLWKKGGYATWDGKLTSDPEHKASYHISVPDWSALERATGKSSYNVMYVLDVDVDVAGTVTTVRSPQFERTQPLMIRT